MAWLLNGSTSAPTEGSTLAWYQKLGEAAFAISGIRLAAAKQFDWFGAYAVGLVTAIGGGTLRDVLLNATPFWMINGSYLTVTAIALIFVIIFKQYLVKLENTFFIFDTIGLALSILKSFATLSYIFPNTPKSLARKKDQAKHIYK